MRTRLRCAQRPRAAVLLGTEEARPRLSAIGLAGTAVGTLRVENFGLCSKAAGGALAGRICDAEQRS